MSSERVFTLDLGRANKKQSRFYKSRARYTAYGGARGGGKSHALRTLALKNALKYPNSRTLVVRRTYPELEAALLDPFLRMLPPEIGAYAATRREIRLKNGSVIRFGHFGANEGEYQGHEYDFIFIDEATQLTERQFRVLGACLRGVTDVPRRMYLTCNPGGVGHFWVKRLFVSREYENGENPEDYAFIPATVEDNFALMEKSPEYIQMLELLPEDIQRAHRFGDWDALSGRYFTELREGIHRISPMLPDPRHKIYRSIDYGLDMFACLWTAVDFEGVSRVYREVKRKGLLVSEAARLMRDMTPP